MLFVGNKPSCSRYRKAYGYDGQDEDFQHGLSSIHSEAIGEFREEKEGSIWKMGLILKNVL